MARLASIEVSVLGPYGETVARKSVGRPGTISIRSLCRIPEAIPSSSILER